MTPEIRRSIPMRSPRRTSTCSCNRGAHGPPRSKCGHGSSGFDRPASIAGLAAAASDQLAGLDTRSGQCAAAISPGSLGAEAENAVPVSTRRARAEVGDALPVESVQLHCRRGGGELLKQRFGLVPALLAEVRQGLVETGDLQERVAADLALDADGLENRDTLALALHPHLVHFSIYEVLHGSHDVLGDEDAHAVFLGEILEARGEV